jgi:cytochrome c553
MRLFFIIAMLVSFPALAEEKPKRTVNQNWAKYCATCHGDDGVATEYGLRKGAPEDIYRSADGKTVKHLFKVITEGGQWMRGFEKQMTDEERQELAQHIEYTAIINRVMEKRKRIETELDRIKRDYKTLPECETIDEGWLWK